MQRRALASCAAFATLILALAPEVLAQGAPTAAELRERAQAALASGDVAGACQLFEQSHQAAVQAATAGPTGAPGAGPAPDDVLFDLASCHEKQGRSDVAATEYDRIAAAGGPRAEEAKTRAAAVRAASAPAPTPTQPPISAAPPSAPPAEPAPLPGAAAAPVVTTTKELPVIDVTEPSPTRLGDFMDTRLTWTFGDDDVLKATGLAFPLSPNISIGERRQYRLFFDNLNSRFGGRENLTHLALYKKMPGFINNLDTEASLVLRFDIGALSRNTNNLNQALYDSGSYIRAFYHTDGNPNGKTGLGITLWPLDTDRFRLGYLYDISWGGTNASINQSIFPRIQGSSPGAKVQFDAENWSVYAGFKTATIVQVEEAITPGTSEVEEIRIGQTNFGVLAGASVDAADFFHVDVGGGYFDQGRFDLPDVSKKPVYTFGFSGRIVVHHKDMQVAQSIDFLLYRNDPNKPQIIFKPESYTPGKTTWAVSIEASNLFQELKDFDAAGETAIQPARAVALQANVKSGYLRGSLTGIYRDLPFVLRNQPSYIPFQTLPKDAATSNELFFALAADYHFPSIRLTPGIGAGLQLPATFQTNSTDTASSPINRTVVVREQGNIAILPVNEAAVPILQARFSLRWDVSKILSAIAWIQYVRDNNSTFVERDPSEGTVALRSFISPDFLGLGTSVQARF
jgi:hypothetical protein